MKKNKTQIRYSIKRSKKHNSSDSSKYKKIKINKIKNKCKNFHIFYRNLIFFEDKNKHKLKKIFNLMSKDINNECISRYLKKESFIGFNLKKYSKSKIIHTLKRKIFKYFDSRKRINILIENKENKTNIINDDIVKKSKKEIDFYLEQKIIEAKKSKNEHKNKEKRINEEKIIFENEKVNIIYIGQKNNQSELISKNKIFNKNIIESKQLKIDYSIQKRNEIYKEYCNKIIDIYLIKNERKNKKKIILNKKNIIVRFYYILFIIGITLLFKIKKIKSYESYITLKVPNGNNLIYSEESMSSYLNGGFFYGGTNFIPPDKIIINGKEELKVKTRYNFIEKNNNVTMIFNEPVTMIQGMFMKCKNISEIDLSHFDTSQVTKMSGVFYNCESLKSINLSNFNIKNTTDIAGMFHGCSLLSSLDLSSFNTSYIMNMDGLFYRCYSLISLNLANFDTSKVITMPYMFYDCKQLVYVNLKNAKINSVLGANHIFDGVSDNLTICTKYSEWNDLLNGTFISNEYNENDKIFCFIKSSVSVKEEIVNKILVNITGFESFKENKLINFNRTNVLNGNDLEVKYNQNIMLIISTTDFQKNYISYQNKTSIILSEQCESILKTENGLLENEILYILKTEVTENGMKIPKIEYEIYYYSLNESKLILLNLTSCKNDKVSIYIPVNISDNFNVDKYNSSSDYYNNDCSIIDSNSKTDISLKDRRQIFVDENMTLCEENCDFKKYNKITKKVECSCYIKINLPFIDEIKFDKKELFNKFTHINTILNINLLKCYKEVFDKKNIKTNLGLYIEIIILSLFLITLILFIFKFHLLLMAQIKELAQAKININNNQNVINDDNINKKKKKKKENKRKKGNFRAHKDKSKESQKNQGENKTKNKNYLNINNNKINNNKKYQKETQVEDNILNPINNKTNNNNIFKKNKKIKFRNINKLNNISQNISKISQDKKLKIKSTSLRNLIKSKNSILEYTDTELDLLDYSRALIYDRRVFAQYYISLLRKKQLFLFSFYCNNNDYNSYILKVFLFFFFFNLNLVINALFFNDTSMHKIYKDEGEYNIIYQIPQIIYSALISGIINTLIKYLSLSEKLVIELKQEKNMNKLESKYEKLKKTLFYKFTLFFILIFLFLLLFSYYIICFCGIYINTQIHLIKNTAISFITSSFCSFVTSLIPGIFRIPALRAKKKDKKCLYSFSKILALI